MQRAVGDFHSAQINVCTVCVDSSAVVVQPTRACWSVTGTSKCTPRWRTKAVVIMIHRSILVLWQLHMSY